MGEPLAGPASPQPLDRRRSRLNRARRLMGLSLFAFSASLAVVYSIHLFNEELEKSWPASTVVVEAVGRVAGILTLVSFLSLLLLVPTWFALVFFCYTRYSLRTMLLFVVAGGLFMSLVVSAETGLRTLGIVLLAILGVALLVAIASHDPGIREFMRRRTVTPGAAPERPPEPRDG
jgi:hypothetical protein